MNTLTVCPATLLPGFDTYSPFAIKELFEGQEVSPYLDIDFENEREQEAVRENMSNMSISGAQEKFSAVIENGLIRLSKPDEQATYILKPAPFNYSLSTRKQIPANEHLTMQIASQVYGIRTAKNALCFSRKGQPVYITKRFDVKPDLSKYPIEDFASVLGMTEQGADSNFKYDGNYVQIADAIREIIPTWIIEMEQFFKLVLFDYMYANEDAHMKNFSLINRDGEFFMAPAYDLINTRIHLEGSDLGLKGGLSPDLEPSDVLYKTGHLCRLDFERFAARIGLPAKRASRVLDLFMEIPQEVFDMIGRSFLNDKMKRNYKRVIEQRRHWFIRHLED